MRANLEKAFETISQRIQRALYLSDGALLTAGIPHLLVGGIAVSAYGTPRTTKDVDYVLSEVGYVVRPGGIVLMQPGVPRLVDDVPIDCILTELPDGMLEDAFTTAQKSEGLLVAPPLFLAYMKLLAFRPKDRADLASLLEAGLGIADFAAYLERWDSSMNERFRTFLRDLDS